MSCEFWWSGELQAQRVCLAMAAAGHQIPQTLGHSIKNFDLLPSPALPWERHVFTKKHELSRCFMT